MRRARALVAATLLWTIAGLAACADEPTPVARPSADDLVHRLDILRQQQDFTAAQVRCVADTARRSLDDATLRRFERDLDTLERTQSIDRMNPRSRSVLVEAISICAVPGGG